MLQNQTCNACNYMQIIYHIPSLRYFNSLHNSEPFASRDDISNAYFCIRCHSEISNLFFSFLYLMRLHYVLIIFPSVMTGPLELKLGPPIRSLFQSLSTLKGNINELIQVRITENTLLSIRSSNCPQLNNWMWRI